MKKFAIRVGLLVVVAVVVLILFMAYIIGGAKPRNHSPHPLQGEPIRKDVPF